MTILSPALDAALAGARVTMFGALKIELSTMTARLLDGSAEITIDGEDYAGSVEGFGTWESIEEIEDGFGDEAPGTTVTILPEDDAATALISDPDNQYSPLTVMVGARDDETGLPIGEPYVAIRGVIDVPIHNFGLGETAVELDVVSEMELLMFNDEDRVMSPAFHHRVWPGELGMDHCTGVADNGYWGQNPPSGGIQSSRAVTAIRQAIDNRPNMRL
ncbi:hypothetical protein ACWGM0_10555 [Sphingomonas bisphenolicum]